MSSRVEPNYRILAPVPGARGGDMDSALEAGRPASGSRVSTLSQIVVVEAPWDALVSI